MYRGGAAQIFIEQYWLRLEIVSLMNSNLVKVTICRFWTKRELIFGDRKGARKVCKAYIFFIWHVLDVLGRKRNLGDNSAPRNSSLILSTIHSA